MTMVYGFKQTYIEVGNPEPDPQWRRFFRTTERVFEQLHEEVTKSIWHNISVETHKQRDWIIYLFVYVN